VRLRLERFARAAKSWRSGGKDNDENTREGREGGGKLKAENGNWKGGSKKRGTNSKDAKAQRPEFFSPRRHGVSRREEEVEPPIFH
jgi:hypothetical protein